MADGVILVVDAQEGPMPQTRFVLTRALALGLKPVVVINKIDKTDARIAEVEEELGNLFLDLAVTDAQLEYPTYYAVGRDGRSFPTVPVDKTEPGDLVPIFEAIINHIPAPSAQAEMPFQMQVTSLDWDSYQGKYCVGRILRGAVKPSDQVVLIDREGAISKARVDKVFVSVGLNRVEVDMAGAGEIVQLTGIADGRIGDTLTDPANPDKLPSIEIEQPTLQVAMGPNTSPFAGTEGNKTTSRQIAARLQKELETNVSLRVEEQGTTFLVSGRGELHLSVLIETLRREGFELEVGKPTVVIKEENGVRMEPVEELIIEVPEEHLGAVNSELGRVRAVPMGITPTSKGTTRLVFRLPTRSMLGLRTTLLTATKGTVIMNSLLIGYEPAGTPLPQLRNGVLISAETGNAITYSLKVVEERGTAFVGPGTKVYEGMVIGLNRRGDDMEINVCKEKKLTNVRSSSTDMTTQLTPYIQLSLEEALDFIELDELLEVTPKNLRLRKRYLTNVERKRHRNG